VLRDKFKRAPEELAGDRAYIEACTVRVVPTERLNVVPDDEDDNRLLECAVARECECVVTGDGDLLRMGSDEGIRILSSGSSSSASLRPIERLSGAGLNPCEYARPRGTVRPRPSSRGSLSTRPMSNGRQGEFIWG
jgi:hypothetical protein